MLSRRSFLRYAGLVSAGLLAADQLELLDKLAPRSLFASAWPTAFDAQAFVSRLTGFQMTSYHGCDGIIEICGADGIPRSRFPLVNGVAQLPVGGVLMRRNEEIRRIHHSPYVAMMHHTYSFDMYADEL